MIASIIKGGKARIMQHIVVLLDEIGVEHKQNIIERKKMSYIENNLEV